MRGIRPPGVRHRSVQVRAWRDIKFRRMNYPNWPPEDSSTIHPLEPWGRQLLVFNAYKTVEPKSFQPQGSFPILPPEFGVNGTGIASETVLCVTDFARRPLLYLNPIDFQTLMHNLGEIKEQLKIFKDKLKQAASSSSSSTWQYNNFSLLDSIEEYELRREFLPQRSYGRQRVKKGEHNSWGMSKGENRPPKT